MSIADARVRAPPIAIGAVLVLGRSYDEDGWCEW
jgi:hypothetical protein